MRALVAGSIGLFACGAPSVSTVMALVSDAGTIGDAALRAEAGDAGEPSDAGAPGRPAPSEPGADAPQLLFSGALAEARVPGWNASEARPLLLAGRHAGSHWTFGGGAIHADGRVSGLVVSELRVFGWDGAGAPKVVFDGRLEPNTRLPMVRSESLPPLIVLLARDGSEDWLVGPIDVDARGVIGRGIVAQRARVFAWPDGEGPRMFHDGPVDAVVPGWSADEPRPLTANAVAQGDRWWGAVWITVSANGGITQIVSPRVRTFAW